MNDIEQFYNKFNEDKRLKTRHGRIEYEATMHYILQYIEELRPDTIVDIGAGTGAYSLSLLDKTEQVIAIDVVKYNLGRMRLNAEKLQPQLQTKLTQYKRDARKLRGIEDDTGDITLLLGPMYHLDTLEKRRKALSEAIRITKPGGVIFVGYIMNEYAVIMHGFNEHTIMEDIQSGRLDADYRINNDGEVYSFVRLEDIDDINRDMSVKRDIIFAPDGAANYLRPIINSLSEEEFEEYVRYQIKVSGRADLLGASAHLVDVLRVD